MNGSLESLLNLYVFTTGRGLFAMRGVRKLAQAESFTALVAHCDAAISKITSTRELERRWAGEPTNTGSNPEAAKVGNQLDTAIGAIRDGALGQTKVAKAEDPIHDDVAALVKKILPDGLLAFTRLGHIEKLAAVDEVVALLQGEFDASVKELGLSRLVKRLAELAVEYHDALEAPPVSIVAWDRVRAARAECQGMLLETICIILGAHHDRSEAGSATRFKLLEPILVQNEAIGQYLRSRRTVDDVNPETGDEEPAKDGKAEPKPADKAEPKPADKAEPKPADKPTDKAEPKPDATPAAPTG